MHDHLHYGMNRVMLPSQNSRDSLDLKERRKRKLELITIALLSIFLGILTFSEFRLTKLSSTLPFANSIFFFGLLNVNLVILIALVWLVFRNIGKLFIERRRKIFGTKLKTKLVITFLALSIIPTLVLFVISALYINSSFDKWFSLKIQNTFDMALEITQTYYRNTEATAMHFAENLSKGIGHQLIKPSKQLRAKNNLSKIPAWIETYLENQRELLSLDAAEYYHDPYGDRLISKRTKGSDLPDHFPRLSLDVLEKAFAGEKQTLIQHIGSGDLIRCLVPIPFVHGEIQGVVTVDSYIPVSLVNKVDEIANVSDDYKDINPLKYPMKTIYLLILVMITLVIIFVAIWVGLYMAKELTIPLERLVYGAQEVGAGNLDVSISGAGHDEISVLVESFNKMTHDLRENRERLSKAQREMAWREVARRIAHEIKNPLTPIKLSAQRLQRQMSNYKGRDGALLQECTETIIKHTDEMKEMVNEFSSFARFPAASPALHDLNKAIGEVITLFRQGHSTIQFAFEMEAKLPPFEFDRDQIKRVIINLLDNAVSALSLLPLGKIRQVRVESRYHEQLEMAVITVKDNGPGMPEETRTRVFEPYFSTKTDGTGLGLAIVKRIINDHDGFIRVHSDMGEGTEFLIELPTRTRHKTQESPIRNVQNVSLNLDH